MLNNIRLKYFIVLLLIVLYVVFLNISFSNSSDRVFYNSSDKLWAHRVLNTNDANIFSNTFNGIEIDVFYNLKYNSFTVKHNSSDNGVNLNEYFANTHDLSSLKLWIDFKNLNSKNVDSSILALKKLVDYYDINDNIIIESKDICLLDKFKKNAFNISYWLPDFHLFFSVFNILEIKDNLLKFKPEAISMPYSSIRFYSKKFPNYPIHCWTNNMISKKDMKKIKNLSQMSNVKVILTDLKDNFLK
jgi:hypothetical protein